MGDENSNKHFLIPSLCQLGVYNAIKIVCFYLGPGRVAFAKFKKAPPVLSAEHFKLVASSVIWNHAVQIEVTK